MIVVADLIKSYGHVVAVDGVSFRAEPASIFGLLGPNGAGKTTTIACIAGLLQPDAGRVTVLGHDVVQAGSAARARLGVVPQELALYEDLSARDNLEYWGGAYGLRGRHLRDRVDAVLDLVGLSDWARKPVKQYSGGMKRRLNFACGVVHEPAALLLDEPTVGVDPQSRVRILDLIRALADAGTCVVYTTHYMEEAEQLCERLAIIDHGKIAATGTLRELRTLLGERDLLRLNGTFEPTAALQALDGMARLEVITSSADALTLAVTDASQRLTDIFAALTASGATIRETTLTEPNLESLFIKLTGRELRE